METIRLHTLGEKPDSLTLDELTDELMPRNAQRFRKLVDSERFSDELDTIHSCDKLPDEIKSIARRLIESKPVISPQPESCDELNNLLDKIPVATSLVNTVKDQINLYFSTNGRRAYQMMPLLLIGKPGIGKTWATQRIAEALKMNSFKIDLANGSESFFLSGSQRGYINSTPGEVARNLAYSVSANPIGILDEIDKANFNDAHRPSLTGPLLSLLEPETSKRFSDASLRLEINTSLVSWIATANYEEKIPEPILNRFLVINFSEPTMDDMRKIMVSVTKELLREYKLMESITIDCTDGFLEKAIQVPSRTLQRAMLLAITRNLNTIVNEFCLTFTEEHLKSIAPPIKEQRRIGFYQTD